MSVVTLTDRYEWVHFNVRNEYVFANSFLFSVQYYDTLNIFESLGEPSPTNPYVFNGDYVDRGSFSVENVLLLVAWKLMYPEYFHLTRGNHETKDMNTVSHRI